MFDDPTVLAAAHAALYDDGMKTHMADLKGRGEEQDKLARLVHAAAELTGRDFEHRGRRYRRPEAAQLLKNVEAEIERDYQRLHEQDRQVFLVHYAMAAQLGDADAAELERWYRFHLALQDVHSTLVAYSRHVQTTLAPLGGERQVSQAAFQNALGALRAAHDALETQLRVARELFLPPLTNVTAGSALGPFLLSEPVVRGLHAETSSLDGAWIQRLMTQMGEVIEKSARILFKSLGGLLALQERIAERWATARAAATNPPAVQAESS